MKRIITLMTIIGIVMQSTVFTTLADNSNDVSETVKVLECIGIYQSRDDMNATQEYLTREVLAQILSVFAGNKRDGQIREYSGESYYSDVEPTRPSAYEIMLMTSAGHLSGYTDKTFRPEGKVRCIEALKSFVSVLGYNVLAINEGDWPSGYQKMAAELGLMKNISIGYDEYITKGDFTKLLWNALNTEVLLANFKSMSKGDKLLNVIDFYETKGIVTATDKTALFGYENAPNNFVRIGDTLLYTEEKLEEYLGKYVIAYYEYTEEDEVVLRYIGTDKNKTKIIEVLPNDILDTTTISHFDYYDGTRVKSVDITNTTSVIFNGRRLTYFGLEHLIPKVGNVKIINADGKTDFETIVIESYVDYFVSSVYNDGTTLSIAGQNGNPPITIELDGNDSDVRILKGETVLDTSVLKQNMLISVAGDKMELDDAGKFVISDESSEYKILVLSGVVFGNITKVDNNDFSVTVNEVKYNVSKAIDLTNNYMFIGKTALLYINAFNEVAKIQYLSAGDNVSYVNENLETVTKIYNEGESYGFIQKVIPDEFEEKVYVNIFTQAGEFKKFVVAPKIRLDQKLYKKTNDTMFLTKLQEASADFIAKTKLSGSNASGYEQLVRYSVNNEGELASIDTIARNYESDNMEQSSFRFGMRIATDLNTIPGLTDGKIHKLGGTIEGVVGLDDNVPVFVVPYDYTDKESYSLKKLKGDIIDKAICLFDMDDFNVAKAALQQEEYVESISRDEFDNMMVVTDKEISLNADDEVVSVISGYKVKTGSSFDLELTEMVTNEDDVDKGDIIRWIEDARGRAKKVEICCTVDGNGTYLTPDSPYTQFYAGERIAFGTVKKISDGYIKVRYMDEINTEINSLDQVKVVLLADMDSRTVITKGDLSMVKSAEDFGDTKASKVFMYMTYHRPQTIIIYN